MADIFISYKREDRVYASGLADSLGLLGYTVWWDASLVAGERFAKSIADELVAARCVVVVWSAAAAASQWVRAEARIADARQVLIPITVDGARADDIGGELHVADFRGWKLTPFGDEIDILSGAVELVLSRPSRSDVSYDIAFDESGLPLIELREAAASSAKRLAAYKPKIANRRNALILGVWLFSIAGFLGLLLLGVTAEDARLDTGSKLEGRGYVPTVRWGINSATGLVTQIFLVMAYAMRAATVRRGVIQSMMWGSLGYLALLFVLTPIGVVRQTMIDSLGLVLPEWLYKELYWILKFHVGPLWALDSRFEWVLFWIFAGAALISLWGPFAVTAARRAMMASASRKALGRRSRHARTGLNGA